MRVLVTYLGWVCGRKKQPYWSPQEDRVCAICNSNSSSCFIFNVVLVYCQREAEAIPERNFSAYLCRLLCRFLGNTQFFNLNPASQRNKRNIPDTETILKLRGKLNINQRRNIVQVILLFWLFLHESLQTALSRKCMLEVYALYLLETL